MKNRLQLATKYLVSTKEAQEKRVFFSLYSTPNCNVKTA